MSKIDGSQDGKNLDNTFRSFVNRFVSTPKSQTDIAKKRWPEVVEHLESALGNRFVKSFLSGSYARKVQVRRLKDIDIIIELNDVDGQFFKDAAATLKFVAGLLADFPGLSEVPEIGVRAVTLHFSDVDFKIDVVPAIPATNDQHWLAVNDPEKGENKWALASPKRQLVAASKKNEELDGNYTPATKLVKEWNQSFGEDKHKAMPSYLAESILFHCLSVWDGFEDAAVLFFSSAVRHLAEPLPSVTCPGDEKNFVDEKLEDDRRLRALSLAQAALSDATQARDEDDADKSMDLWAKVFTAPDFPAPKNDPSKLASALGVGGVTASGLAVAAGHSGRKIVDGRSWRR